MGTWRARGRGHRLASLAAELSAPGLAHVVDLVAYLEPEPEPAPGRGLGPGIDRDGERSARVVVANSGGASRIWLETGGNKPGNNVGGEAGRQAGGEPIERHQVLHGRDPLACTDPLAFLPYELEIADPGPDNAGNAYPEPARRLLSFFADPDRSPDLVVIHTPRHYFPEAGGHRGEHGSLDVIQSRAPFVVAGCGIPARGVVPGHARVVDVAPTLLQLAGVGSRWHRGADGRPMEGRARTDLTGTDLTRTDLTGTHLTRTDVAGTAFGRYVVGLLWDGAHCGDLLHLAARGDLPALARLLASGTALSGGAVADFPSVTLCNHTSALTGVGPGRHGVLGNAFYDRAAGRRILANDESTWHRSARWLRPGVATAFEVLAAARPGSRSACVNEAIDRGATTSTMQLIRARGGRTGGLDAVLPPAEHSRFLGRAEYLQDPYYRWCTSVDDAGLAQMIDLFRVPAAAPDLTWWSSVITDAGHHAGGPRSAVARESLRDADRRLGAFLQHLDRLGIGAEVTFLLTADHGFEAADPQVTGSWSATLATAVERLGIGYRDEGPGFIYLAPTDL